MLYMYRDFFPLLKAVFELIDFDAFQCFRCFFLFYIYIGEMFPFQVFFQPGKQKKSLRVRSGE